MFIPYHEIEKNYEYKTFLNYTVFEYYCTNPRCTCDKVDFHFMKYENDQFYKVFSFTYYFDKNTYSNISVNETVNTKDIIESFLASNEINEFKKHYLQAKQFGLKAQDEPKEIEEDAMYAYAQFYEQDDSLKIQVDGKTYFIYDQYCVEPSCECNDVILDFFLIDFDALKFQHKLQLNYYFYANEFEILDKAMSQKQAQQLIESINKNIKLKKLFKTRYHEMKEVGKEYLEDDEDFESNDEFFDYDEDEYEEDLTTKLYETKYRSNDLKTLLSQIDHNQLKSCYGAITGYDTNLTKTKLIKQITETYESMLQEILNHLHSEILDLIFEVVDRNGEIYAEEISIEFALISKINLIAFPVTKNNEFTLIMSQEALEILKHIDREALYQAVKENDTIIRYTRKLLDIYGEYDSTLLFSYLEQYENIKSSYDDKVFLLNNDSTYSGTYDIFNGVFSLYTIDEIEDYYEILEQNPELDYYKIPKSLFYQDDYPEEVENLYQFFDNLFESDYLTDELVDTLISMIKLEIDWNQLIDVVKQLQLDGFTQKKLEKLIKEIYLNTRLYSLRGHTRNEVNQGSKLIEFKRS